MKLYRIRNMITGASGWHEAPDMGAALVLHENRRRAIHGLQPLSMQTSATVIEDNPTRIDCFVGFSEINGPRADVIQDKAENCL